MDIEDDFEKIPQNLDVAVTEPDEPEEVDPADDEGEGGEQGQSAEPHHSRRNDRIEALRDQARRAQQERDDLERQLNQYRQEHLAREQMLDQRSEEEQLANMTYEQQVEYRLAKAERQQRMFEEQQRFLVSENNDKTSFNEFVAPHPEFRKMVPQVEAELQALRQRTGFNVPRQLVLATLIGLQTMQAQGQVAQQRQQGQRNVQRQRTAPTQGQSDVPRRSDKREKTPRERLEGVTF